MNEEDRKKIETPQKPLRTYESDVAEVLAEKNISTTTIAMAEKRRQTGESSIGSIQDGISGSNPEEHSANITKKLLIGLGGLVLVAIGIIVAFLLYNMSPLAVQPVTVTPVAPTSIVPADSRVAIPVDNMLSVNIMNAVKAEINKNQPNNTIKELVLTQSKDTQKFRVNATDAINFLGVKPPDILLRSLSDTWMLGVHTDNSGNKDVFVITTINYFQNAFAGMLSWESVMPDDLKQYLPVDGIIKGSFTDRIIQNSDVREFVTSDGKVLFLYAFIGNSKLVITGSESTLVEILNRLEQKGFLR